MGLLPGFSDERLDFTDETDADQLLRETYPLLWVAVVEPWNRLQVRRRDDAEFRDLSEEEIASWLHWRIRRNVIALCEEHPAFKCRAAPLRSRQFFVDFDGRALLVFKKLRRNVKKRRLERSNYLTRGNLQLWQQRRKQGYPDAPRLIVGYEPIKELTEIKMRIAYPRSKGRGFNWAYELPDQTKAVEALIAAKRIEPPTEQERKRGFVVKHRRMDSEEHGS